MNFITIVRHHKDYDNSISIRADLVTDVSLMAGSRITRRKTGNFLGFPQYKAEVEKYWTLKVCWNDETPHSSYATKEFRWEDADEAQQNYDDILLEIERETNREKNQ